MPQSTDLPTRLNRTEKKRPDVLSEFVGFPKIHTWLAEEAATAGHSYGCGCGGLPVQPQNGGARASCSETDPAGACCVWSKTFPLGLCLHCQRSPATHGGARPPKRKCFPWHVYLFTARAQAWVPSHAVASRGAGCAVSHGATPVTKNQGT